MKEFKKYVKKIIVEARQITQEEVDTDLDTFCDNVSVSVRDIVEDHPKIGDMIVRYLTDQDNLFLVTKEDFEKHFEVYDK